MPAKKKDPLEQQLLDIEEKYALVTDFLQLRSNIDDLHNEIRDLDHKMLRFADEENFVRDVMTAVTLLVEKVNSIDNKTDLIMEKLGMKFVSAAEKEGIEFQ